MRFRAFLANALLVVASVSIFMLVIEVVTLNWLMPLLPLKVHHHFYSFGILAQPTKRATLPKDYIALLGDSYAHGAGDWLFSVDHDGNPPFHSTDAIHRITGRDVVTFAISGSGSIDGLITAPVRAFETINSSPFVEIDPPTTVVIYFYEGNDPANNARDAFRHVLTGIKPADVTTRAAFAKRVVPVYLAEARRRLDRPSTVVKRFIYVTRGVLNLARRNWKILVGREHEPLAGLATANLLGDAHPWLGRDGPNQILVGDRTAGAPSLQGPSVELDDAEIDIGATLFERSLEFVRGYFPRAGFLVVYVPAPLSIYHLADQDALATLQVPDRRKQRISPQAIRRRSDRICALIAAAARRTKTDFLDIRPALRAAARRELLHGPVDPDHFNQRGYEILGRLVAGRLMGTDGGSADCARTTASGRGRSAAWRGTAPGDGRQG